MTTDLSTSRRRVTAVTRRKQRRVELEAQIEQQRVDIFVAANRWRRASGSIDEGWRILMRFRVPLYAVGGALLVSSARHPRSLVRIARRLAAGGLLINRARRLLHRVG